VNIFVPLLAAAIFTAAGCGSPAAVPSAPTANPGAPPVPSSSAANLTGTWTGTGTDAQGAETFVWTVTQNGDQLTGSATMNSANPSDGSCGSCHKQKAGTLTGTMTNGALSLTLDFPAGGSDITPLCGLTLKAATNDIAGGQIAAAYTGTTTCEGPIADGTLIVRR
jgi:hypothetical protein